MKQDFLDKKLCEVLQEAHQDDAPPSFPYVVSQANALKNQPIRFYRGFILAGVLAIACLSFFWFDIISWKETPQMHSKLYSLSGFPEMPLHFLLQTPENAFLDSVPSFSSDPFDIGTYWRMP